MTEKEIITIIKDYNNLCSNINKLYKDSVDTLKDCENKTIDYYHQIELDDLTYHQLARLTKEQKNNLIQRRKCKDFIDFISPLKKWLDSGQTTHTNKQLAQSLREMERVINKWDNRQYKKRSKDGIINDL